MAADDEDDLFNEEFDLVDDDEFRESGSEADDLAGASDEVAQDSGDAAADSEGENLDEYGRPVPAPNYVVHVYEYQKFKRTIDRPFTPEDAEAFASEYNRTGKSYGRVAVAGKNDAKPKKSLS